MAETRFCSNCREEIPRGGDTCPACGVFAGDVFDGRFPRRSRRGFWMVAFVIILAAAAGWLLVQRRSEPAARPAPPVTVVSDRPGGSPRAAGATMNEAEAIRILRRHFVANGITSECLVISSQGPSGGTYRLTALNRCQETRLGRWLVDGKSGEVRR